jgi:hypothetical protein
MVQVGKVAGIPVISESALSFAVPRIGYRSYETFFFGVSYSFVVTLGGGGGTRLHFCRFYDLF